MKNTFYGIAVDIGTTTVAMSLMQWEKNSGNASADGELTENADGRETGKKKNVGGHEAGEREEACEIFSVTFTNPQRKAALGSDVLSRAKNAASDERVAERMRQLIRNQIADYAKSFLERAGIKEDCPIVISGNTTMLHIFSGLPTGGLLRAPFIPGDISLRHETIDFDESMLYEESVWKTGEPHDSGNAQCEGGVRSGGRLRATIFPCISAFVGGDIVAGIYALDLTEKKEPTLFIDLGTNGEMALAVNGRLYVTSVAAGPAFEGGNISIGMAAVEGAISHVKIKSGFCRTDWLKSEDSHLQGRKNITAGETEGGIRAGGSKGKAKTDQSAKGARYRPTNEVSCRPRGTIFTSQRWHPTGQDKSDTACGNRGEKTDIIGRTEKRSMDYPRGICGSGLFDAVAEMYLDGIIDCHGTLSDRYIDEGFPIYIRDAGHRLLLKQDDIRAFQTAKAAVCAGAMTLLRAASASTLICIPRRRSACFRAI